MSEELDLDGKSVKMSDEEFVNTLKAINNAKESQKERELKELASRLHYLQQQLNSIKDKIKREKAFHELRILSEIIESARSVITSVEDMNVASQGSDIIKRAFKEYNKLLDREFGKDQTEAK